MFRAGFSSGILLGLLTGLLPQVAQAADHLRGVHAGDPAQRDYMPRSHIEAPRPRSTFEFDWAGVYGGAFAGTSLVQNNPSYANAPQITGVIPSYYTSLAPPINGPFPNVDKMTLSFGAFAGINYLWDDVVLGIEADYTRANGKADRVIGPSSRQNTPSKPHYILNNTQEIRVRPTNWGTLRGRVGYASGMFMPYVTLGMAAGLVDTRSRSYGTWTEHDSSTGAMTGSGNYSAISGKNGFLFGGAFGAGIEAQAISGTFLRAEWLMVKFARPAGGATLATIHTGRIGGGVKF